MGNYYYIYDNILNYDYFFRKFSLVSTFKYKNIKRVLPMLEKSSHNGSKEASTFFGPETNKVNNLYNYNETNENLPQ